jgi:hypothetical protein
MLLNQFKQRNILLNATLTLILVSTHGLVNSQPIAQRDMPNFGPSTVLIDFQSLTTGQISSGSLITNNVRFDTFGGGYNWSVINIENSGEISLVSSPTGDYGAPFSSSMKVSFDAPVSGFAFQVRYNDSDWKIRAYNSSNTLIAEYLVKNSGASEWYGLNDPGVSYFIFENTNQRSLRPDGFNPSQHDYVELDDFVFLYAKLPLASDTLSSFSPNAFALRNAFNLQSAKIAQGLSYDCTVYDEKNICVSFAGTRSEGKDFDATTGALIMAHQPSKHFRLGAYVDQSYDASTSGGLTTKNGKPGFGVFGVWTQNTDGLGAQVRVSANMGKVGSETQREAVETAEAGFGKSNIESRGWQLEYSQGYAINSIWTARPYVGYRKTTHTRAAYTEQSSEDVTAPLTYGSVKQNTDTVTAGITFAHTEMAKTSMFLTAGVEHELRNRMDRYGASSSEIEGIGSIDLSTDKRKTHLALALTVNHDIDKTQRIGVSLNHRKEAFAPGAVTSAGVQYSKGF